jgi:hypothetical protein
MKHLPFQSIYRENFEVVEQRQGNVTLYPHTDQLPLLARALNLEFHGPLPGRLTRVDHRASGFLKLTRYFAAETFCNYVNASRPDRLLLFPLLTNDLVARMAVAQQITEHGELGRCHRFRLYAGADLSTEIHLSGKRIVFAEHVLQRFSSRVPNHVGTDLAALLLNFFTLPIISLPINWGRALVISYGKSILAFPYKEKADEYFLTTCLTVNEINTLGRTVQALNFHYGPHFTPPRYRHWTPTTWMKLLHTSWLDKIPPPVPQVEPVEPGDWSEMAQRVQQVEDQRGHGPGSTFMFLDHVPGPAVWSYCPGQPEAQIHELALEPLSEDSLPPPVSRPPLM